MGCQANFKNLCYNTDYVCFCLNCVTRPTTHMDPGIPQPGYSVLTRFLGTRVYTHTGASNPVWQPIHKNVWLRQYEQN